MEQISDAKKILNQCLLKKAILNFIINIILNFIIQYFSLINYTKLEVIEGEQSLVKVFLPLAFLLPFFITLDIIKYVYKMVNKGELACTFKKDFKCLHYACKIALTNGISMLFLGIILMFLFSVVFHDYSYFDKNKTLIFQVTLSGILAILFTYQPIFLLKNRKVLFV